MPGFLQTQRVQGYIYPEGTLTCDSQTGSRNGVLADGSAEFPDKVLGTWICRGWVFGTEDRFFDSAGVKIRDAEQGKGEPVVLIHGFSRNIKINRRTYKLSECTRHKAYCSWIPP